MVLYGKKMTDTFTAVKKCPFLMKKKLIGDLGRSIRQKFQEFLTSPRGNQNFCGLSYIG